MLAKLTKPEQQLFQTMSISNEMEIKNDGMTIGSNTVNSSVRQKKLRVQEKH